MADQDKAKQTAEQDAASKTEAKSTDTKESKEDKAKAEPKFTEADLQSEVDRRVTQALKKREEEHEQKLATEREEAEQKRLEEQGKWQEAAEAAKKKAKDIETTVDGLKERAENAEKALAKHNEAMLAQLDDDNPLKAAVLAMNDPVAICSFLAEHSAKIFAKADASTDTVRKPVPTNSLPKPKTNGEATDGKKRLVSAKPPGW